MDLDFCFFPGNLEVPRFSQLQWIWAYFYPRQLPQLLGFHNFNGFGLILSPATQQPLRFHNFDGVWGLILSWATRWAVNIHNFTGLGLLFCGATWKPLGFHNFSGLGVFFSPGNLAALRLSQIDAILFYLILKNKMNTSISRGNILMLVRKGTKKNIIIKKRKLHIRGIELGNF